MRQHMIMGGAALGLMLLTAGLIHRLQGKQQLGEPGVTVVKANTGSGLEVVLPERVLDFESEKHGPLPEELGMLPKDTTYGRRIYKAPDGFMIAVSVVMMGTDRTSIHRPEFCLTGQGWKIDQTATGVESVKLKEGHILEYNRMLLDKALPTASGDTLQARGLYLYWFVADGRQTPGQAQRMWWMAEDLLRAGKLQRWAYVAYFTYCSPEQEPQALERLRRFITASSPEFQISAGAAKTRADDLRNNVLSTMLTHSEMQGQP